MRIATLPPRTQVLLTIIIPVGSLLLAFLLVWPYLAHLREVKKNLAQTQETITEKRQAITQAEAQAAGRNMALAIEAPSEEEPIKFLKELAALAGDSHVSLTAVRASSAPAALPQQDNVYGTKPQAAAPPPAGATPGQRPVLPAATVRELQDQVTVEGPFSAILSLLVRLENYQRLLSVSKCTVRSSGAHAYPKLQAVFTLSRFVAAGASAPAASAPAVASHTPITSPTPAPTVQ